MSLLFEIKLEWQLSFFAKRDTFNAIIAVYTRSSPSAAPCPTTNVVEIDLKYYVQKRKTIKRYFATIYLILNAVATFALLTNYNITAGHGVSV